MRSILGHDSKILFDKDTQLLLTPKFWILPLYREFLNSARRIRPSPSSERARGCTGLVKVICKENKEQKGKRKYHAGMPHPNDRGGFTQWFTVGGSKPPLGSPKKNSILCSLTRPPDATAQTHMKRKSIVGLESKKSKHGGRDVKIGWHTIKAK